jgi:hypothetical protein
MACAAVAKVDILLFLIALTLFAGTTTLVGGVCMSEVQL